MTISKRLAAHRDHAPVADSKPLTGFNTAADESEDEDTEDDESTTEEDQDMTNEEMTAAIAAARKEGFDAATARMNTVLASDHYAGREQLAKTLLATDLSAEQIVASLEAAPGAAPVAAANPEASADADRDEMRAAIQRNANAAVDTGDGSLTEEASERQAIANGFARAVAHANQMNGY